MRRARDMLQDLRYALRGLRRQSFAGVIAIVTLALGIGGATAVFSVVRSVLLRPLPFHEPDRLVRVWELTRDGARFSFSEPNYLDVRAQSRSLQHVTAYAEGTMVFTSAGEPIRIKTVRVTASLCDVLGVRPRLGRMYSEAEDRPGRPEPRVVLADALWRERLGADPQVVGRLVTLDSAAFVVTGVMPPGFDFPNGADAWIPLGADPTSDRGNKMLAVVARLAPGATLDRLGDELRRIARGLAGTNPEANAGWSAAAVPFSDWLIARRFRDSVWALFGAVGVLLLLACANVANLLAARAAARRTEIRVRAALGASRMRLVRQLFTEAGLLAMIGTGLGVLLAIWSVEAVRRLGAGRVPRLDALRIDPMVLLFACAVGAASCLIFGLAPALYAVGDPGPVNEDGPRATSSNRQFRDVLVIVEVALALLLLVSAGLVGNSFVRLLRVDPGFAVEEAVAMPVDLPSGRYDEARTAAAYRELLDRIRALPGVAGAGATSTNPFRESGYSNSVTPAERAAEAPPSGLVQAGWRSVTPGLIAAMRIPLLSGRDFSRADQASGERVMIVSEGLARRLWPGGSALGKQLYWGGTTGHTWTVVGVIGDIRDLRLDAQPGPMVFLPHGLVPVPAMTVIARAPQGVASVGSALRDVLRQVDPMLPPPPVYDLATSRAEVAAGPRFNLSLFGAFALLAVVLAVTGVYAMLAFTVLERRREIAVRLALGADGARVARLVLRSGLTLAASGIAAGAVAAFWVTRALASLLYGVQPTDPLTFAGAAAMLLAASGLACYLPARQAARVDPVAILRE